MGWKLLLTHSNIQKYPSMSLQEIHPDICGSSLDAALQCHHCSSCPPALTLQKFIITISSPSTLLGVGQIDISVFSPLPAQQLNMQGLQ